MKTQEIKSLRNLIKDTINSSERSKLSWINKSVFTMSMINSYCISFLLFSFLLVMFESSDIQATIFSKMPEKVKGLKAIKNQGLIHSQVNLPEVNIVAQANSVSQIRSDYQSKRNADINYNGRLIPSINLPQIEIIGKR